MTVDPKQMFVEETSKSRRAEGRALGMMAFRYGYPSTELHRSRWEWHHDEAAPSYLGSINRMHHTPRRAEPKDTYFVSPIVDAPYSRTFLDLSAEPYVLSVPVIDDRYFTVQMLDYYTNSFAYVGSRLGDTYGGDFLIVGPDWRGVPPEGFERLIVAPTPVICMLARVTILDDDVEAAVALQGKIGIRSLSEHLGTGTTAEPVTPTAYADFKTGDPLDFYRVLNHCLTENPPPPRDAGVLGMLARVGVGPGTEFDPDALHPEAVEGLKEAIPEGIQSLFAELLTLGVSKNSWVLPTPADVGNFGTNYFLREEVAQAGLLANSCQEAYYVGAIMDGDGELLSGENRYVLHFGPDDFPPVEAFWSVTMYLNPEGFLVENDIGRYVLGSLTPGLHYNDDGSLDLFLQRDSPGADRESNWLPCTEPGKLFRLIFRQYVPKADIITGRYAPPPVERQV
ncbi:MAG TPA: DUF1254 domain-containing protein [Solirubrobacterales bacterium]|jgi:hypothetical protein|nr:DUF1254 domain-containing protein [Solirubrobacterales bacterium]